MPTSRFCQLVSVPERSWRRGQAKAKAGLPPKGPWPAPTRDAHRDGIRNLATKHAARGHRKIWALARHNGHQLAPSTVLRILDEEGLLLKADYQRERRQLAKARKAAFADAPTAPLQAWQLDFSEFETAAGGVTSVPLDGIVRAWQPNRLGLAGRLGVYASRWGEFLADDPREANSAGGVFPAIWGTVTMTLIMAMLVAPFGVLAALYLREYATSGPIVTAVRIAINNLAGVPSIVYGAFGLGFFCYGLGAGIDELFFQASTVADGQPVFGTGGLLWASLTLALLTLPVVIVATEEALSAVPNSMREGSYACGAGKWQTIRRIVLPRALPGIMTGLILAMARGAGEVAPLMLVGVKKLALDLPVDGTFPFVHPEREFMHLAYLIYDVGFQSADSQAAQPMVFTITFLLVVIIALLNIAAIWLRSRLRRRYAAQTF